MNAQLQVLWTNFKWWILGGIAVLLIACCGIVGATAFIANRATLAANPPTYVAPIQQPPSSDSPQQPVQPPVEQPAQPTANPVPLTIAEFQAMWSSTPTDNPGPLMRKLDTWYDTQAKALQVATWQFGFQKEVGGWTAIPGSIVWTDTKDLWFSTLDGSALDTGDVVRLRCQGNWCVYAIYDNVVVPTPGRMAILERWLDPANDLAGW